MEETRELYGEDAYLKEFDARVLSCERDKKGYVLILEQTAFYPEGGGQPYDQGRLNDVFVKEVHRKDGAILHYTDDPIEEGTLVRGVIDFDRRFDLMQQHSGEHVFSGLVHKYFGYDNIGFHLGEEEVVLDFSGPLDHEQVKFIEEKTNEAFQKNIEVRVSYPSKEELDVLDYRSKKELSGKIRIVTIEGCDICACCGTHVRQIGEVALCKVLSLNNKKGNARIAVLFGKRAVNYVMKVMEQADRISVALSKNPTQIYEGVKHLQDEYFNKCQQLNLLYTNYFEKKYEEAENCDLYVTFEEGCSMDTLRHFADRMSDKAKVTAGLLKKSENEYQYVLLSKSVDVKEKVKTFNEALHGKGGGDVTMVQGFVHASKEEIEEMLRSLFE
ncbi:MAG: alanyl-tRNA editing protein [Erysipelotrichaceae bacterium]|nr:alanyl-tRNA editing protein [Erysipelotrichaceae bacterium]